MRDIVAQELGRALRAPLRPALRPPRREAGGAAGAAAGTPRPQWQCTGCGTHNWPDRAQCRSCSKLKGAKREPQTPKPEAAKVTAGRAPAEDGVRAKERPPPPEVRCAEARAQADALAASAATLKAAGLGDHAAELEKEAAELRKKSEAPPAGRRLDLAQAYLGRCEARARKAADAVEAAKAKAAEEEALQRTADKEVEDAKEQVEKLRGELGPGGGDAAMGGEDGSAEERLRDQEAELAQLRRDLGRVQAERDEARAAAQLAPTAPLDTEGDEKGLEELEAELRQKQEAFAKAVREGNEEAQDLVRVRQLAELSEQVAAKRRRV